MKELVFRWENAIVDKDTRKYIFERLKPEIAQMQKVVKAGSFDDERSSINLPAEHSNVDLVNRIVKKIGRVDCLVVCGIGGSNLGTMAVAEAVRGKRINGTKVFFADTVDPDSTKEIVDVIEPALKAGRKVVVNGVSKSGSTTETVANFQVFVNLLKKYRADYKNYVVVTSDYDSPFWKLAGEEGFITLAIPSKVGGRYSVFSFVGLFPLAVLGVNITSLLRGATSMRDKCVTKLSSNPAAMSAILQFMHYSMEGRNVSDMFLFAKDLESLGNWYRQLMGESVGKEYDESGTQVLAGITPTVSVGSIDLHSVAQLYLGGPYDKFHTFVSLGKWKSTVKVPSIKHFGRLVRDIQGKSFEDVMGAILQGIKTAFRKDSRPFCEVLLPDKSEESVGQFMQWKMCEMMYLGFLMGVNPFNQPNVESYKKETRELLK